LVLYEIYQAQRDLTAPANAMATVALRWMGLLPVGLTDNSAMRFAAAMNEMVSRARLNHSRPEFGIGPVLVDGQPVDVEERTVATTPFGSLLHFAKEPAEPQPRVLIVTALAGHFSTLLRSTVAALLPHQDVFLIDWHNARDVPLDEGEFGLDDYVDLIIDSQRQVGAGAHLLAVCQPCPAALVATAIMAESRDPAVPRSLTLMAGPIDGRVSATSVNQLAIERPLSWFEDNVIATVPWRYAGRGRRVYPGFLQLAAFMSMNFGQHVDHHLALFHELAVGDMARATVTKDFYDEYFSVLDLPALFYLETVDRVFQRFLLATGHYEHRGRKIDVSAINRTALLTVEGSRDDICGLGQTMAAQDLCPRIPRARRRHHLQAGVGHYGVFSGTAWEKQISPVVRNFILANN
jgi:poly(3-hydroxybutyrate) depolymerase